MKRACLLIFMAFSGNLIASTCPNTTKTVSVQKLEIPNYPRPWLFGLSGTIKIRIKIGNDNKFDSMEIIDRGKFKDRQLKQIEYWLNTSFKNWVFCSSHQNFCDIELIFILYPNTSNYDEIKSIVEFDTSLIRITIKSLQHTMK